VVAGLHEPLVDLGRAERGAALDVGVGVGERLEVEQRRAVGADGEPERRIEMAGAGGGVDEALGDHLLELAPRHVARHQAVAVVVDERNFDVNRHCGAFRGSRPGRDWPSTRISRGFGGLNQDYTDVLKGLFQNRPPSGCIATGQNEPEGPEAEVESANSVKPSSRAFDSMRVLEAIATSTKRPGYHGDIADT